MVSHSDHRKASVKGAAKRAALPGALAARYDRRTARVVVTLASGLDISFSPQTVEGLEAAKAIDLTGIEISPSGFGLHFPKLDADIYLPALLDGFLGSRNWMAARLGERGGKAKTSAKARAARRNGKLGGRPRRSAT
jgi:hypothetical protein